MKLYAVQLDIAWENKQANFRKVSDLLERTPIEAGSLVVLPEWFSTGFSMNVKEIYEGVSRETEQFLQELAERHKAYVMGGLATKAPDGRGWNEAAIYDPSGREIARYCKMHPFSYAGETNYFIPGTQVVTFPWNGFTVAPFICYDLRFPEVFRHAVQLQADLFVVIACWPKARETHWMTLLQARAIENQAYVVGVNRCGNDPTLTYSGRSRIIDPHGYLLADAETGEGIVSAGLDREGLLAYRREFPALADIRAEYKKID
jgi:omega-amidase